MIDKTRQATVEMRSDKGIQHILVAAHDLCNSIETEAEFQEPEVRPLKKKKQYGYESLDEASPKEIQAKLLFCVYLFIYFYSGSTLCRNTINSLKERFEELNAIYEKIGFYLTNNIYLTNKYI
ncbi:hypothetical protein AVEN_179239-1 [Araneus ventricosus]|uniref:Uncharacterized protein n=1 Tax=Araneus ventricosus TaxID=182803 RepID=A0A4Y2C8R8_ARAVE|nr:hypothetical protein AVEN_179239-1 [Araneus ventricosus]